METSLTKVPRIEGVDALRGFAVMAIVLVHNLEHFIFSVYPTSSPAWLQVLDQGVFTGIFALFAGKAYAIFALLFGFTFYIQSHNQRIRGKDFGYRFLWRLILLVAFATLDAAFFPAGDVLLLFAVVGLVLFFTRNWSNRALLVAAVFFLLQPVEWYHFVAHLVNPTHALPDWKVGEMYATVGEVTKSGNFWDFLWCNITLGQKASLLWAVNAGRFFQTAGLFLLGFYLGRTGRFAATEANRVFWMRILILSAVLFSPLYAWHEELMKSETFIQQTAGTAFDMWQKLAFTAVLVASFLWLYQTPRFSQAVSHLRFYGRMSLTNYISQSVIGSLIYFPFGLYLAPYCGYTVSLLIGIVVFVLQIAFCRWWLARHKQGPLESLWHRWTWIGSQK